MSLQNAANYHLDLVVFVLVVAAMVLIAHRRDAPDIRSVPYPPAYVPSLVIVLLLGLFGAHNAGQRAREGQVELLRGLAPTFAAELMALGLRHIGPETSPDDPTYLALIEAQKRWLAVNTWVKDIYTVVLAPDDRVLLIVDSETDYNRDGDFSDAMEARTPIGMQLADDLGEFRAALEGKRQFGEPHADQWGFWVTAFEQAGANDEGMPIVVGLDYDAEHWLLRIQQQRALVLLVFTLFAAACISIGRRARITQFDLIRDRLVRDQLAHARQSAEAASMSKSAFLASMSHEIRTPMNGVLGMLDLIRTTRLNEEQLDYVETAYRSGRALLEILNDVLDYSKVEAGMLNIETIPTNLRKLLQEITSLHSTIARARGLTTSMHVSPEVPQVLRCDPFRVRQILDNLIGNALKFTSAGSVGLMVESTPLDTPDADCLLRISVRDSGIGIPRDMQQHIFDPFAQADQSTSRRFGGTGLGLAICRRLVTMMGGQMGVESAVGIGSIFWFTLPVRSLSDREVREIEASDTGESRRAQRVAPGPRTYTPPPAQPEHKAPEADVAEPPPAAASVPPAVATQAPGTAMAPSQIATPPSGNGTDSGQITADVLVVEDNEVNQLVIIGMLKRIGYSCELASDGLEALQKLRHNHRYRLVFMDMRMPRMDGLEAARQWRGIEGRGARVPIIAMTANVLPEDRDACLEAGMDDFIGKPVNLDELRSVMGVYAAMADKA